MLHWEPYVDEETCLLTVSDEHKASISFANQAEYESWIKNEVFTDNHQHCISTKWVITEKGGRKIKACLVARGLEELGADDIVRYSQTSAKDSLRLLLAIVSSSEDWEMGCMDVHTAFLQGKKTNRHVFVASTSVCREKPAMET